MRPLIIAATVALWLLASPMAAIAWLALVASIAVFHYLDSGRDCCVHCGGVLSVTDDPVITSQGELWELRCSRCRRHSWLEVTIS